MKNLNKKYQLIHTGGDVVFIGKRGSKNFIERESGIHGDWSVAQIAANRAGVEILGNFSNKDFIEKFDALKSAAEFVG